ncbi:hypothetical protein JZ751_022020 [Albula glossodonta]|uniref:Uncharacterized protein n=1 Tax=Albula glossodonta TaxID=121402 RepID=A0A8T2NUR4_9TELE|nr:hypothetical protein JZ751_022020 [Albula glossodonta]
MGPRRPRQHARLHEALTAVLPCPWHDTNVVILYFQPSVFRCILLRWVRLLGFATVYGTVTLKLYRYASLNLLPGPMGSRLMDHTSIKHGPR